MKNILWVASVILFASVAATQTRPGVQTDSEAQQDHQMQQQVYSRGRGGIPFAWNDRDKDGTCDVTGRRAGQGRPSGLGAGRGRGHRHGCGICDRTGWQLSRGHRAAHWPRGRVPASPPESQSRQ
jgi:hypothetical protein